MKSRFFGYVVAMTMVIAPFADVASASAADGTRTVVAGAAPIPYVPFTLADVINPNTQKPYLPGEIVSFKISEQTTYTGPVEEYLTLINDLEKKYNEVGETLRKDGEILHKYLKDPEELNAQVLNDLGLSVAALKDKIKPSLADCETLKLEQLGVNATTSLPYTPIDRIDIEPGVSLNANQFVGRVNNVQKVLCSIGYSLLGELGGAGSLAGRGNAVRQLVQKRVEILDRLGISKFDSKFGWQSIEKIKSYAELSADAAKIAEARRTASPELLNELRKKSTVPVPTELQIPDLPNIPAPVPPKRKELELKKRKDWSGFNEGNPSRFSAYASAFYEIRGTEKEEEAKAEGKAGVSVFGNEVDVLKGVARLYAGPDKVSGLLKLTAFGQDVFDPLEFNESVSYKISDRKHFKYSKEVGFSATFMVGPIPVTVGAGVAGEAYVGWELALLTTELSGALTPGADISAYVRGGVGVGGIISAGAEGSIDLIDLSPVLSGSSGIRFDSQGIPFLRLGLNGDLLLDALKGRVSLYAEYPVPRFGIPPWKIKKSKLELFSWGGIHYEHKIFNWGMDINPFGATLSGDLVDQTDREETRALNEALSLEQRKIALVEAEKKVIEKERATFAGIGADLGSTTNERIPTEAEIVHQARLAAAQERTQYLDKLAQFASH